VTPGIQFGRKQKAAPQGARASPRSGVVAYRPFAGPAVRHAPPRVANTFQALCQTVEIRIFICNLNQMMNKNRFLTKCFQSAFLLIPLSIREFIVQRKN
jgi:hypothetical protein